MFETDTIQILGAQYRADVPASSKAAEHRGALKSTITGYPFAACTCGWDGPITWDKSIALSDLKAHLRGVAA